MPVAYRFADAEELWFFVSELRGPGRPRARRASTRASGRPSAPRSNRAQPAPLPGFELAGVSLNVAVS